MSGTEFDDLWGVVSVDDGGIRLRNQRTKNEVTLGYDHVYEFRTPDFLVLKSKVLLSPNGAAVEPLLHPPKVVLAVREPIPKPVENPDGTWTQEVHVHPTGSGAVRDATVEIRFDVSYSSGEYEVVPCVPGRAMMLNELFGVEGRHNSAMFRMGLAELPPDSWIRLVFRGESPPVPREVVLNPCTKY